MVNLSDIVRQAVHGHGVEGLGRQFGLAPEDAQRAVEALLPAFSLAFQRLAFDPAAFAGLASMVGSGVYRPFFDGAAPTPSASPNAVVTQFFGSQRNGERVAEQAAAFAGVAQEVMHRMLPVIAATLIGGMSRYATMEGFADLLRRWSDAIRAAAPPAPSARPAPAVDPWAAWTDMVSAALGTKRAAAPPPRETAANPVDAWMRTMQTMWGATPPPPPPPPAQPNPVQALAAMFETGRDIQGQYLTSLTRIMDDVWKVKPAG